jgi:hypothetical protein
MPRIKLTKSAIDALPTPSSDVVYWDAAYPGFGVKITPKGRKVFIVLYRTGGAGSSFHTEEIREHTQTRSSSRASDSPGPSDWRRQAMRPRGHRCGNLYKNLLISAFVGPWKRRQFLLYSRCCSGVGKLGKQRSIKKLFGRRPRLPCEFLILAGGEGYEL